MGAAIESEPSFRSEEEFTQADFRAWLARRDGRDLGKQELMHGRIVMSPPARWQHGGIESTLVRLVSEHIVARQLGRCFGGSAGYELPSGDTLQPDLSFVAAARWATGPPPGPSGLLRVVPSLVIEILSPSTARRDRTEKLEIYAANGVDETWLVDPVRREIMIFHHDGTGYSPVTATAAGPISSRVLTDFAATVEDVFVGIEA